MAAAKRLHRANPKTGERREYLSQPVATDVGNLSSAQDALVGLHCFMTRWRQPVRYCGEFLFSIYFRNCRD